MSPLQISLLGPFGLAVDDRPIPGLTSPKTQALVAYLALEANRPYLREHLAELLWPNRPPGTARQNLRQSLSRLGRALPGDEPLLIATRQSVQFNANSRAIVDATQLLHAVDAAKTHKHDAPERCVDCCQSLADVAALYAGDLLEQLDADSAAFDEWLLLKRESLRREMLYGLDVLTRSATHSGDAERALHYARRQGEIEPLHEPGHRQIMRALAVLGRQREALAHYEALRQRLRNELDVEPSVETTALRDLIEQENKEQASKGAGEQGRNPLTPTLLHPLIPASLLNFPTQHTPFVGRGDELAAIAARLRDPHCRLLTLLGPGGVGKTRLAVATAQQQAGDLANGAAFVALAPLAFGSALLPHLARALNFNFSRRATTADAQRAELLRWLAKQERLLLLDNAEHLLSDETDLAESALVDLVVELMAQAPRLKLLVTSRARLNLRAEWIIDVSGLSTPPVDQAPPAPVDEHALSRYSAVQLFVQSAQRIRPDFALSVENFHAVAHLCRRVEGVPLAMELAAGWVRDSDVTQIAQRLDESLDLLHTTMRDVPPRHRSLRAVFDSTSVLMSPAQRQLFSQLTVFRGAFNAEAAKKIADATPTALDKLIARSLLRQTQAETPTYELHQTLRQYAAETLADDDALHDATHARHSRYFAQLVQKEEAALNGIGLAEATARLHTHLGDVLAAWRWAVAHDEIDAQTCAFPGLVRYFIVTSQSEVGLSLFEQAVERLRQRARRVTLLAEQMREEKKGVEQTLLANLLALCARLCFRLARYDESIGYAQEALAVAEHASVQPASNQRPIALAHLYWSISLMHKGDIELARAQAHRCLALARDTGWPKVEADALRTLGILSAMEEKLSEARRYYEQSLAISQRIDDLRGASASLGNLGDVCRREGRLAEAEQRLTQSLHIHQRIGDRSSEGRTLTFLGELAADRQAYTRARTFFAQAEQMLNEIGERHYAADALVARGKLAVRLGDHSAAVACWQRALAVYTETSERVHAEKVESLLATIPPIS